MTSIGEQAWRVAYNTLEDVRASVRINQSKVIAAITDGVEVRRETDEVGTFQATDFTVHCLSSDVDARHDIKDGDAIEVKNASETEYRNYRVASTKNAAGMFTIQLFIDNE